MNAWMQEIAVGLLVGAALLAAIRRWLPWRRAARVVGNALTTCEMLKSLGERLQRIGTAGVARTGCGGGCSSCGGCGASPMPSHAMHEKPLRFDRKHQQQR